MKFKFYMAAALAVALMSCKNNGEAADAKNDSTGAKTENTAEGTPETPGQAAEGGMEETADGKILLRLNYSKGFEQELSYDMDMAVGEMMKNKVNMTLNMKVVSESADEVPVYGMTAKITRMKMDSEAMGQKIKYDSSKKASDMTPEEKQMDASVKELINKSMNFSLNNQGKMVGKMEFEGTSANADDQPFDMDNLQMAFPEKPIGVGESWTNEVKGKKMSGGAKNTYTIKKITDDEVEVALKSVIGKMQGTTKETVITGTYTLDRKTGMVKKGSMAGDMDVQGMKGALKMTFAGKRVK